jgi:hypothetical protein
MFETPTYLLFLLLLLEQSLHFEITHILPSERMPRIEERREQKRIHYYCVSKLRAFIVIEKDVRDNVICKISNRVLWGLLRLKVKKI